MPILQQVILGVLIGIVVGLLGGLLLTYYNRRVYPFTNRPHFHDTEARTIVPKRFVPSTETSDQLETLMKNHPRTGQSSDPLEVLVKKYQDAVEKEFESVKKKYEMLPESILGNRTSLVVKEPIKPKAPNLLLEARSNLIISAMPSPGGLVQFQTNAWDTNRSEVDSLPVDVQEDLRQVYIDIRLANNLVWLATEAGLKSRDLDDGYIRLSRQISIRLDKIIKALTLP